MCSQIFSMIWMFAMTTNGEGDADANTYIHSLTLSCIQSNGRFHSTNPFCHPLHHHHHHSGRHHCRFVDGIRWLQATRFSHKTLNAVRIRFAFIRLLVMWCESHKSLKSLSFHFHCSYYLALSLIFLFISWIFHENRRIFPQVLCARELTTKSNEKGTK